MVVMGRSGIEATTTAIYTAKINKFISDERRVRSETLVLEAAAVNDGEGGWRNPQLEQHFARSDSQPLCFGWNH